MSTEKQRYRMTFKCECGNVFQKITQDPNLTTPSCPECKKKNKKTVFHRLGDGPVPTSEKHAETQPKTQPSPNTIYQCDDCRVVSRVFEDVGEKALHACLSCDSPNIKFRGKISHDVPMKSHTQNKCIDKTADIVMADYGMSDLKSNVRVGESMAPKLAGGAQSVADQMMGMKANDGMMSVYDANTRRIVKVPNRKNGAALAKRAMTGGMRDLKHDPVGMLHTSESRGLKK